jgi:NADH-quinone oxidoreductase subunit K|tara:strand:+ start:1339 stop:1641 length:303 start_codon:yes stop_codon:yes gene_type:complete
MNIITIFALSFFIFFIGIFGIMINRKNILTVIICFELILLSVNLNLLFASYYLDDILGQIFVVMILTVASAETSIGLAILIIFFRLRGSIAIDLIKQLKG